MAHIRPFRGIRYNADRISFISRVITPPYDVIKDREEHRFEKRDPYNFIKLSMGKPPSEGRGEEAYAKIANTYNAWLGKGVLVQDEKPSLYVLEQEFEIKGITHRRRGFIAAVLLEDLGRGSIHPHENTMDGPKIDRVKLMESCQAALSQPIMIHSDTEGAVNEIIEGTCTRGDFIYSFRDDGGTGHTVWQITDESIIGDLSAKMEEQSAVIADGHHRYESALSFAKKHRPENAEKGSVAEDYMPVFLVSVKDKALISLPTHRGVKTAPAVETDHILEQLKKRFSITELEIKDGDLLEEDYERARQNRPAIGCVLKNGRCLLLEPEDIGEISEKTGCDPVLTEKLPVSFLHNYIFKFILGIEPASEDEANGVEYTSSASEIYWGTQSGKFSIGFVLPSTPPDLVQKLAQNGKRLPIKSTFFYPKIPSGIVIYPHKNSF